MALKNTALSRTTHLFAREKARHVHSLCAIRLNPLCYQLNNSQILKTNALKISTLKLFRFFIIRITDYFKIN